MKIVKNVGQCKHFIGKSKYLFQAQDKDLGTMYAKIGLSSIIGWGLMKIKFYQKKSES